MWLLEDHHNEVGGTLILWSTRKQARVMIAGEPNEGGSLHLNKLKYLAINIID